MNNLWGWFFVLISFLAFVFLLKKHQRTLPILICGLFVILVHHILSYLNVVYGPFSFTENDAWSFHRYAYYRVNELERLHWTLGSELFKSALTVLYKYLGISIWLGQAVSILFFSISCAFLVRMANWFSQSSWLIGTVLLIYGLLPSSLMFGCFILRETYLTCFFICGIAYAYQAIEKTHYPSLLLAALFLFLMGFLHQVMLIYALAVTVFMFVWFFVSSNTRNKKIFVGTFLLVSITALISVLFLPVSIGDNYFAMLDIRLDGRQLSIPEAVNLYRESINQAQATTKYIADISFSSWAGMIKAFFISYLFYLGWPFFGDYSQFSTWIILAEALFRLCALISLLFIWRDKRIWWFVFAYFSMTLLWNIGTTNHGQALRHHFMTEWILLLFLLVFVQQRLDKADTSDG